MKIEEMVRLLVGEELALVVPPCGSKVPRPAREVRRRIVEQLQKVIRSTWDADSSRPEDRSAFIHEKMRQRAIIQSGQQHLEVNVVAAKYPERASLALPNPLPGDVRRWLGSGNAGFT